MEASGPNAKRERGNVQTKSSNNAPEAAGHSGAIFELITHLSVLQRRSPKQTELYSGGESVHASIHLLFANQTADGEGWKSFFVTGRAETTKKGETE